MTDHDETNHGPQQDHDKPRDKPAGIVARLKKLYEERPVVFAVLVIGASALVFLLGSVLSGGASGPSNLW